MTGASIASLAIGIGTTVKGAVDAEKAKDELQQFNRQELENSAENIKISTIGAEQETEAQGSRFATSVESLQRGGARAQIGALPQLSDSNVLLQNIISKGIEEQDVNRSVRIAQGEDNIRAIRERREIDALLGLGQQLQTGRQDAMSGLENVVSSTLLFDDEELFDGDPEQRRLDRGARRTARRTARENRIAVRNA